MKELIDVYTAEMARKDYEENKFVIRCSKYLIDSIERKIEEYAKKGNNFYGAYYYEQENIDEYAPYIIDYFEKNGYSVEVRKDTRGVTAFRFRW